MAMEKSVPERREIAQKDTWKIEDMIPDHMTWEKELEALLGDIGTIKKYQGRLKESADALLEALRMMSDLDLRMERLYVYAHQNLDTDTRDNLYQGMLNKAQSLEVKLQGYESFMEPEILDIPKERLKEYLCAGNGIAEYRQVIENMLRQKEHTLSAEMEELLSGVGGFSDAPQQVYSMFTNADLNYGMVKDENGEEVEITNGRFVPLLESSDRSVRKAAFQQYYKVLKGFENTLASLFYANVKKDVFYARARGYHSALEASLDGSNIPTSVYENLIQTIHKSLPLMHRYMKARKKALGVDELHMYDVYAPLVQDVDMKISFEKAKEMVKEGLKPMGEDYQKKLQEGFDNRWIDVYENKGKRSGAYSWGCYGCHPYVLLNYKNTLDNVFTLAHEMGHALHSYYSDANQTYVNAGYRLFVAEVASTCNESLLIHDLLKKTQDKKEKAYLINYFMNQFKGTIFRQTMFAEFEKLTHEKVERGESLTADELKKMYHMLNVQYFGEDMVSDEEIDMEWARIPHFYRFFYVYQYATGFSAAIALSKRIMELGEQAVTDYMKFLTGGCSKYPIDLLKDAGVDMTTSAPIEAAMDVFADLIKQFEVLMKEE